MPIEIIDNPQGDMLEAAFDLIRRELESGRKFSQTQKDLGIRLSIDALAVHERPWFFEVAALNRIGLWQTLWGQWRRCQEWGTAQAPLLDPGWADNTTEKDYGIGERECKECGVVFTPRWAGEAFCSNACGVAEEKRKLEERNAAQKTELLRQRAAVKNRGEMPVSLAEESQPISLRDMPPPSVSELLSRRDVDDEKSMDLGTDFAETEK